MATPQLKGKATLDDSQMTAAFNRIERGGIQAAGKVKGAFANFGSSLISPISAFGPAIAAAFSTRSIAAGVAGVFNAGRELVHLSNSTGIAVPGLVILQSKFKQAGLEADGVGAAIGRMQKTLSGSEDNENAGGGKQLHALFKDVAALQKMSPDKQFLAIGAAIGGITDPAQRTAAAMQIFGREGRELVGVFASPGFQSVSPQLQQKAEMFGRNAAAFEKASVSLERISGIFKTFYAGTASGIVDGLNPVLDRLEKINLAKQGQDFGDGLSRALYSVDAISKIIGSISTDDGAVGSVAHGAKAIMDLNPLFAQLNLVSGAIKGFGNLGAPIRLAQQLTGSMAAHAKGFYDEHAEGRVTIKPQWNSPLDLSAEDIARNEGRAYTGARSADANMTLGSADWNSAHGFSGTSLNSRGLSGGAYGATGNIWSQISGRQSSGDKDHMAATAKNTFDLLKAFQKSWGEGGGGSTTSGGGATTTR